MKRTLAKANNKDLLGYFVSCVGADYKTDYAPAVYPKFSDDTVVAWDEIESRMNERKTLAFDRNRCRSALFEEISKQNDILKGGVDYASSYHYGIKSGLNIALRIVEDCITRGEDGK